MDARELAAQTNHLQLAITRLAELDQTARRERLFGEVNVTLVYRDGTIQYVRRHYEGTDKRCSLTD